MPPGEVVKPLPGLTEAHRLAFECGLSERLWDLGSLLEPQFPRMSKGDDKTPY